MLTASAAHYFFFLNDAATPDTYTLSLHDALPISARRGRLRAMSEWFSRQALGSLPADAARRWSAREALSFQGDRKSTRLNSSHRCISYAVFCLKKKRY